MAFGGAVRRARAAFTTLHSDANNPTSLQLSILDAYQKGYRKVRIAPGTYPIEGKTGGFGLILRNMEDLEVDGQGVTLVRTNPAQGGIHLDQCRHVVLKGFQVRLATTVRTQGTIVAIAPQRKWFDVVVDKGYPTELDNPKQFDPHPTVYFFDPKTLQWKEGTYDIAVDRLERQGAERFRLFAYLPPELPVEVGDLLTYRNYLSTDLEVSGCSGIQIQEMSFIGPTGWVIHEGGGEGGNYYNYSIHYPPPPPGGTRRPLMAAGADGFHCSGVRHGPIVEGCLLQGMPDDGIAVHGHYAMVQEVMERSLILRVPWSNFFEVGDRVRIYNQQALPQDEALVEAVEVLANYRPKEQTKLKAFQDGNLFVKLTLDKEVVAQFEFLVSDPAANGRGYLLRNNIIRNHRARGMLLKADNGLVENNRIEGSTIAGIVIAPELWWNEADYSHHVKVRNNHVVHVGYATVGPWTDQAGAISLMASAGNRFSKGYGHRDVSFIGNTVEHCNGVNLLITSAEDVEVRANVFRHAQQKPCERGANWVDPKALIYLTDCNKVHFANNRVENLGTANAHIVEVTLSAKEVTMGKEGVV